MKLEKDAVWAAVLAAVDEVNQSRPDDKRLGRASDTLLYGGNSGVDSITLVNVVSAVEQHIYEATGVEVLLASEAAMSRRNSPYRSLGALAEYAIEVAEGSQG